MAAKTARPTSGAQTVTPSSLQYQLSADNDLGGWLKSRRSRSSMNPGSPSVCGLRLDRLLAATYSLGLAGR